MFKTIVGSLIGISGFLSVVGSAIAMRYSMITVVIMSILKITGVLVIPWFAGVFTAGAISTGIWMLFLGLIFMFIGFLVAAIGVAVLDQ
jgi:hypothetical protein